MILFHGILWIILMYNVIWKEAIWSPTPFIKTVTTESFTICERVDSSTTATSSRFVVVHAFVVLLLQQPTTLSMTFKYQQRRRTRMSVIQKHVTTELSSSSSSSSSRYDSPNNNHHRNNKLFIFGLGRVGQQVAQQSRSLVLPLDDDDDGNIFMKNRRSSNNNNSKFFTNICGTVRNPTTIFDNSLYHTINQENIVTNQSIVIPSQNDDNNDSCNASITTIISTDNVTPIRFIPFVDLDHIDMIFNEIQNGTTHILITIPPDPIRMDQWNQFYDDLMDTILRSNSNNNHNNQNHHQGCYWIGILSTTGVYGNYNGQYVTEESECNVTVSSSSSSQSLYLSYEEDWKRRIQQQQQQQQQQQPNYNNDPTANQSSKHNLTLCIFRCAGIYSNDQSALHTVYKRMGYHQHNRTTTTTMAVPSSTASSTIRMTNITTILNDNGRNKEDAIVECNDITNRIHVYDLAAAVLAAMTQSSSPSQPKSDTNNNTSTSKTEVATIKIYNIADDMPESRQVVQQHATKLLSSLETNHSLYDTNNNMTISATTNTTSTTTTTGMMNGPPWTSTGFIPSTRDRRRQTDQKRVNNTKMKQELISQLKFPTYQEGLNDTLMFPNNPWWKSSSLES